MREFILLVFATTWLSHILPAQNNPPWRNPLMIAHSSNGAQFSAPAIFQDSSGVPSVIRWKNDTLVCVFQWFRQPVNSPNWDRVAVKFSFDKGNTWTDPIPIDMDSIPANFQRPFDPTLAVLPDGRLRLYFSSSIGLPPMGLDASINTYSAVSTDGIRYTFEPDARVDHPNNRVIDPAVIWFQNSWHYAAPIGSPQQGAYHYISENGLSFTPVANIPSDPIRNWTGNFVVNKDQELRFYGSGPMIWYNTSTNAGQWQGYTPTNLQGGDPSVVKLADANYLIIYVGPPYPTSAMELEPEPSGIEVFVNNVGTTLFIHPVDPNQSEGIFWLYSLEGRRLDRGGFYGDTEVDLRQVSEGVVLIKIASAGKFFVQKLLVKRR